MTLFLICTGDNNLLLTDTARRCFYPSHPPLSSPHLFYYHDAVLDLHSLSRQLLQHVGKARSSSLGTLTHRQYDSLIMDDSLMMGQTKDKAMQQDRGLNKDKENDKYKDQGVIKNTDIDKGKDNYKDHDHGADQDPLLSDPSSPGLGLAPQIHADSCHYCAGGLFRAANLLLFDVINHRQQCTYT